jgi:hypothetical protein
MKEPTNIILSNQSKDVIDNPRNPVNPYSKPRERGWILQLKPDEMNIIVPNIGKCICIMKGRMLFATT